MNDRQQLLFQKLKITKQKVKRRDLLNLLPKNIFTVLEGCNYITSPELDSILDRVNELWNFQLHSHDFVEKYSANRKEFSWEKEVIEFVKNIDNEMKEVYLLLGIEDCPAFVVNGKWVINYFDTLWNHLNYDDIWIISLDYNYGVIISSYGGYLEQDPNPNEIFYAITKWN